MSTLAQAVRKERWELAALLLLQGMWEVVQRVPEDAIPQLLEALEGADSLGNMEGEADGPGA
ncbi:MAG: hypothetical protein HY533_00815 [Chloroflexi bacterium]|nr:hypothetical protein [Chloroflexota bacterium]